MDDFRLVQHFINSYNKNNCTDLISIINNQRPYGLSYGSLFHSTHCNSKVVSFQGKRILEMGGALPSKYIFDILEPKSWTAVEYRGYDDNQFQNITLSNNENFTYCDDGWKSFYEDWKKTNSERFDIVYSIAAFEHIHNLGQCLDAIYDMLEIGGKLYTNFTPIWSAPNGSHGFLPQFIGSGNSHEHLLYDFVSLYELLTNTSGISKTLAYEYAHAVYKSDQINRYTYEEYMQIFKHSKFESMYVFPINLKKLEELYEPETCLRISSIYPNMIHSCNGFCNLFQKLN